MFSEQVELRGHIIDSLILPKVLEEILSHGGSFKVLEVNIGKPDTIASRARVEISGPSTEVVRDILGRLRHHGARLARERGTEPVALAADRLPASRPTPKSKALLCPPDFFSIDYEINPWMKRAQKAERAVAREQWSNLRATLDRLGCETQVMPAPPDLPDAVFTANAGLLVGDKFILSNFRFKERRGEAAFFEQWFAGQGCEVVRLPEELIFEGEGDALFGGDILFCGYHFRSDIQSHQYISDLLQCLVISLELVDDRFYHLDTCFCPLPDGGALWYPPAFDPYAQKAIRQYLRPLLEVTEEEAAHFACNAIVADRDIVMAEGCPRVVAELSALGYRCHPLPMGEFLKAGGACKCLTLWLPQR